VPYDREYLVGRAEMENVSLLPQVCRVYWSNSIYDSSHRRMIWLSREPFYVACVLMVIFRSLAFL
jgi:hypothetical protein